MPRDRGGPAALAKTAFALGALGGLSFALIAGCTIRLGQVHGDEEPSEPAEGTGAGAPAHEIGAGGAAGADGDGLTPEQQAAFDALQRVEPSELALRTFETSYAAAMVASLIEAQVTDPATADPTLIEQLIEQYTPSALEAARGWAASPEAFALASEGIYPAFECQKEPYNCPWSTECPYNGGEAFCAVTYCGNAQCPWCPWELGNIIFKSWCSYGCMKDGRLVAGAFILIPRFWEPRQRECTYW